MDGIWRLIEGVMKKVKRLQTDHGKALAAARIAKEQAQQEVKQMEEEIERKEQQIIELEREIKAAKKSLTMHGVSKPGLLLEVTGETQG